MNKNVSPKINNMFVVFRWFTKNGWIGRLFASLPGGDISLKVAAQKTVAALDMVLLYEASISVVADAVSDEAGASVDQVVETIKGVREQLAEIETLPDLAEGLKNYTFSKDPEVDHFIKDLTSTAAIAMSDKKISPFEASGLVARVIAFVKLKTAKADI